MEIKKGTNKFYVGDVEDQPLAEITYYNETDNVIVVDHTIVSEELRGQKMAGKLVNRVVDFARENNLKIVPVCTYAAKVLSSEEYKDVVK